MIPFVILMEAFIPWSLSFIYRFVFTNGIHFKSHLPLPTAKSWYIVFCISEAMFFHWVTVSVGSEVPPANKTLGSTVPACVSSVQICPPSVKALH